MGYHDNEATTKKAVEDAQRFINDRERYCHALRLLGASEELIQQIREGDFTGIPALKVSQSPTVPDGAGNTLQAVRNVLQRAYDSAEPVCCGRAGSECCGSPEPEWSEYNQQIMNDLGPVEQWLSNMLATAQQGDQSNVED